MWKTIQKTMRGLLLGMVLFLATGVSSLASTGTVYFNDPSVTQGDTVTVTMTVTCSDNGLGALDATLSYDSSKLQYVSGTGSGNAGVNGGSGSISISWYDATAPSSVTFSFTFTALAAGTGSVTVSYIEVTDIDEAGVTLSSTGNSAVSISAPVTASSESRLSSLTISPGTLSPSFSSDVYTYTTSIEADVNYLTVSAYAKDSAATVSVSGTWMDPGENTTTITVTAEDGTVSRYVIYTTKAIAETEATTEATTEETTTEEETDEAESESVAEGGELAVTADGTLRWVAMDLSELTLPSGFTLSTLLYEGVTVPVAVQEETGLTLFYLTDVSGENGAFYLYQEEDIFYPYLSCTVKDSYIILRCYDSSLYPEGYTQTTLFLEGVSVQAFVLDPSEEEPEQFLVYAMNSAGETGFYRYDTVEGTFQRYIGEMISLEESVSEETEAETTVATQEKGLGIWTILCIVLLALLILAALLYFLRLRRRDDEEDEDGDNGEDGEEEPEESFETEKEKWTQVTLDGQLGAETTELLEETTEEPMRRRRAESGEEPMRRRRTEGSEEPVRRRRTESGEEPVRRHSRPERIGEPTTEMAATTAAEIQDMEDALLQELSAMESRIRGGVQAEVITGDDDFEIFDL